MSKMDSQIRVIKPFEILMLRGNQSFGDAGNMPLAACLPIHLSWQGLYVHFGLAEENIDLSKFNHAKLEDLTELIRNQLGTPTQPQGFRLQQQGLVRKTSKGCERLHALPSDLVVQKKTKDAPHPNIYLLKPQALDTGLLSNLAAGQQVPLLKAPAGKPETGYWLNEQGFQDYLTGKQPTIQQLVKTSELWKQDLRLGIALDADKRTASDGQIYTTEAITLNTDVYLYAEIQGAPDFPKQGTLRLGGDGRGAAFSTQALSALKIAQPKNGKIKLLLSSPAIFSQGWKLPTQDENDVIHFQGGSARVVTASVPRHQVISGWDLAKWQPKPAERVTPLGSVYWLDNVQFDGDAISLQNALQALLLNDTDAQRQAEGYNACILASWFEY